MRSPVGIAQSVHTEVAVIVPFTEITAVAVLYLTVLGLADGYGVVAPFPDKAAHESVAGIEDISVILEISGAVAHCMAVFAQQERS